MIDRDTDRDHVFFLAPMRPDVFVTDTRTTANGWRIVKVYEHGPYHNKRPNSWRGPFASRLDARRAAEEPR